MGPKELLLEAMRRQDSGDHEGFLAMQAEDCQWVVPGAELQGIDQVREWTGTFVQAFPRFRHDFSRIVETADGAFAEGVWTGTHDGPLTTPAGELPPTGRTVSFRFALTVNGGLDEQKAREVHVYFDQLEFLGQLGLLPQPQAA